MQHKGNLRDGRCSWSDDALSRFISRLLTQLVLNGILEQVKTVIYAHLRTISSHRGVFRAARVSRI
jgi:hypothetical protein